MSDVVGIDSRRFFRETRKFDGTKGHFESVLGVAVKIRDYANFDKQYDASLEEAFKKVGLERDYKYFVLMTSITMLRRKSCLMSS